jgi:hypothetical protein
MDARRNVTRRVSGLLVVTIRKVFPRNREPHGTIEG